MNNVTAFLAGAVLALVIFAIGLWFLPEFPCVPQAGGGCSSGTVGAMR
jgi:hypothetical protein